MLKKILTALETENQQPILDCRREAERYCIKKSVNRFDFSIFKKSGRENR
jgi:hypothetical protein